MCRQNWSAFLCILKKAIIIYTYIHTHKDIKTKNKKVIHRYTGSKPKTHLFSLCTHISCFFEARTHVAEGDKLLIFQPLKRWDEGTTTMLRCPVCQSIEYSRVNT